MKQTFLVFIVLIMSLSVFAQRKISVYNYLGNGYYKYSFKEFPDTITYYGLPLQKGNHQFCNKNNLEIGTGVEYQKNRLGIGLQLAYSCKDYFIDYDFTSPTNISDSVYFNIDKTLLRFRYIDFLLPLSYTIYQTKNFYYEPTLYFGIGFLFTNSSKNTTWEGKKFTNQNTDFIMQYKANKIVYYGKFSFDVGYNVFPHVSLFLSPYISKYMKQITTEPMKNNPIAYGVNIGVKINTSRDRDKE